MVKAEGESSCGDKKFVVQTVNQLNQKVSNIVIFDWEIISSLASVNVALKETNITFINN